MCTGGDFCFTLNSSSTITFFLWTERKRYVLSTTVKWNGWNRMFVHINKKKHHQNKVKIFAVFMFNCIYARRWRSAIKMNEKNTHQTSRSKCNNGLKWFVHTEKNRIYIHHMQKSKGNSWKTKDERKRTNKSHTHDVQINNNCVCYL